MYSLTTEQPAPMQSGRAALFCEIRSERISPLTSDWLGYCLMILLTLDSPDPVIRIK